MTREFSIVREMSRREVERQQKRFVGVTVNEPRFVDVNGLFEWVCDIRVGVVEGWATIPNVLVAQWALGAVTDMNIPVLCERGESGRVSVIARAEINLPDIVLDSYTYEELGFGFMRNLIVQADGSVVDGYGFEFAPAGTVPPDNRTESEIDDVLQEIFAPTPGQKGKLRRYVNDLIEWGSTDFVYGTTVWGSRDQFWIEEDC